MMRYSYPAMVIRGIYFGYPLCCVHAFEDVPIELQEGIPGTPFEGTGFVPCEKCQNKDPNQLIAEINDQRIFPIEFPFQGEPMPMSFWARNSVQQVVINKLRVRLHGHSEFSMDDFRVTVKA